jgi:hypothetical protein
MAKTPRTGTKRFQRVALILGAGNQSAADVVNFIARTSAPVRPLPLG